MSSNLISETGVLFSSEICNISLYYYMARPERTDFRTRHCPLSNDFPALAMGKSYGGKQAGHVVVKYIYSFGNSDHFCIFTTENSGKRTT